MERGLAVRLPNGQAVVKRIYRQRCVPLHGRPLELRSSGAVVAFIQEGGIPVLLARAGKLSGPRTVQLLNGKMRGNGYLMSLSRIRRVRSSPSLISKWHAIGQFRYFNPRRWKPTLVGEPTITWKRDYIDEKARKSGALYIRRGGFTGSVQGRPRSHPEAQLVRRFEAWLGCLSSLEQHWLLPDRFQTDFFDASKWRLVEAKVACDRETLRQALGQLYDYKRFYRRRPSLGILVGSRPTKRCMDYLREHRVTTIWETPGGLFRDSDNGAWTYLRRAR